jgi:hypothetical protein
MWGLAETSSNEPNSDAYGEVCAHLAGREVGAATQPHFIRGPGGRPRLTIKLLARRSMARLR